ncbi:MAG: hypothetical protein IIY70_00560, partial [Oscillospiraceae bacterium]|nr:hypothetical protein [Oscillospiraceae bacterium]
EDIDTTVDNALYYLHEVSGDNTLYREILEKCMVDPETFETFSQPWDSFELYRIDNEALRESIPVTPLYLFWANGYARHMCQTLAEMDEESYQSYLKYHLVTCEQRELLGLSHHLVDAFRKEA